MTEEIPCKICGTNVLEEVEVNLSYNETKTRKNTGKIKHVKKENGETEVVAFCRDCWNNPGRQKKSGYSKLEDFKEKYKKDDSESERLSDKQRKINSIVKKTFGT